MTSNPVTLPPELVDRLRPVRSVGVITGAGVSAESGLQTYRGPGGIYDDPEEGDRTIEALSGETILIDPDRTWRAIARLAKKAGSARPNRAHEAIAAIERQVERFVLLTQNVDGLHQLAGSKNVIDIHGNARATRCMRCGARSALSSLLEIETAPRCPECGGVLRPDVVLFGEMLDEEKVARMYAELSHDPPDLVLLAGTTALFPYIAEPVLRAVQAGRLTVEINPEPTALSSTVDFVLREKAGDALAALAEAIRREQKRG